MGIVFDVRRRTILLGITVSGRISHVWNTPNSMGLVFNAIAPIQEYQECADLKGLILTAANIQMELVSNARVVTIS